MNFFHTMSLFWKNPFINPWDAVWRHTLWQGRKILNLFPTNIHREKFDVRVANRAVANGTGALINAMGYYDPNNMYFLEEIFRHELCKSFYDVGANIGIYSLIVASSALQTSVYAFEPHPVTFSLLQENIALNGLQERIRAFPIALGKTKGEVEFTDIPGSSTNRVIINGNLSTSPTTTVEMYTGDSLIQQLGGSPDVVKIDVEGFENQVLWGFEHTLPFVNLLLVESQNLAETTKILAGEFNFSGPYKMDFRAKRLAHSASPPWEDWIFVQPNFLSRLAEAGYYVEQF
jgi:FkbM family methyltransferase